MPGGLHEVFVRGGVFQPAGQRSEGGDVGGPGVHLAPLRPDDDLDRDALAIHPGEASVRFEQVHSTTSWGE